MPDTFSFRVAPLTDAFHHKAGILRSLARRLGMLPCFCVSLHRDCGLRGTRSSGSWLPFPAPTCLLTALACRLGLVNYSWRLASCVGCGERIGTTRFPVWYRGVGFPLPLIPFPLRTSAFELALANPGELPLPR